MKHFLDITTHASAEARINATSKHSLVIYSPTSLRRLKNVRGKGVFVSAHEVGKDAAKIEELCARLDIDTVIGFGGGTAIDIAKYIAYMLQSKFICMPTILSTNAFATNKVALIKNGAKVTLDAKMADEIILDTDLVATAGTQNLYGLCDILSIHTALHDWRLADSAGVEKIDSSIYRMSQNLLHNATTFALGLTAPNTLDIPSLFSMIGESGHITNIYGSGRPESGSEHIFAKELELMTDIPHGISIASGITLMSHLQDNYSADIQAALRRIGVMSDIADRYDVRRSIVASLEGIRPRMDRYTILDEKTPSLDLSSRLTDSLYDEILGVSNEYSHH